MFFKNKFIERDDDLNGGCHIKSRNEWYVMLDSELLRSSGVLNVGK